MGNWWDPVSWVQDAVGLLSGPVSDVESWVMGVVKTAVGAVERDLADAVSFAERSAAEGIGGAFDLASRAWNGLDTLGRDLYGALDRAVGEAEHLASSGISLLERGLYDARHEAATLFDDARHTAAHELDVVVHDLVDPALSWIAHSEEWWYHLVDRWWQLTDREVIHPIEHGLDDVRHEAAATADWVAHEGARVAELVEKAADWLVWFGVHTIEEVVALPGQIERDLSWPRVLAAIEGTVPVLGDELQRIAGEVFRV